MATSPRAARAIPLVRARKQHFVQDLLKLQRAAQLINSTLDLDELIKRIVDEVATSFGCIEAFIWLLDEPSNEMVLQGVCGCTYYTNCGARLKVGEEGMIGWVAKQGVTRYAPDVSLDPYYHACEHGTSCELDIPLKIGNKVIGVFSAVHHDVDAFPADQRHLLEALCGHIALAVQNARTYRREREERERMTRDAKDARFIQESLLPKSSPFVPGVVFEALTVPAGEVGGDWYDYIDLGNDRWGVVLADVSGKGMGAALLMSATRGILRSLATTSGSPAEVLGRLNCVLKDDFPSGRYVTMIYGVFDVASRTFTFANAGHPHPLFIHDGQAELIDVESGLPLGLGETSYRERTLELKKTAKLLLYSDGISEATDANDQEFGSGRIREHMLKPGASANSLLKAASEHSLCGEPCDDATIIVLRCAEAN
ncbi:MAG: GAF domain-containing SpoIIE family protein phosphatase [Terriglobales bacterium]